MFARKIFVVMMTLCMLMLASIVQAAPQESVDWGNGVITVDGYGVAPARARTASQARMLARRAAVVDAYRNIAEAVKGVNVTAETTVVDLATESDEINTKVNAFIQGARVIDEKDLGDGGYQVTMQVNMFGVSGLAEAVMPKHDVVEPLPSSTSITADITVTANGGYTGVIIDCRDFYVNPVMSPVIRLQDGTPVYGYKNIVPEKVIHFGMAAYSHGQSTVQRAGSNPLVIKAIGMVSHDAYPVISDADASRMLAENEVTHFLDNCKVVIMRQ